MTHYIHHTNNTIDRAAGPLPKAWENVSGLDKADAAGLKAKGWLPVADSGSAGPFRADPTGVSVGDSVTPDADSVTRTYAYKDLADCIAVKFAQINSLRDAKRYPGDLATGLGWNIDLRNGTDEENISGKVTLALTYKVVSDDTAITFVGADNVARDLTADQMITAGQAVDAHVSGIYSQSWVHKAAVAALETAASVEAYDIEADW
jgi:hypothetical protein